MSEKIDLNGDGATGHLFRPRGGSGPGLVVVQEWWGIDPSIKTSAARLTDAGFVALVPDLD